MPKRLNIGPRMSQIVIHDRTIYLAGQTPSNRQASIRDQAAETLGKVDALLAAAGSDRTRLLSVQVFLAHIGDFAAFNEVYDAWVDKQSPPVRACTEARLNDPDVRVEILAIAST